MRRFMRNLNMVFDLIFDVNLVRKTIKSCLSKTYHKNSFFDFFDFSLLTVFWVYLHQNKSFSKTFFKSKRLELKALQMLKISSKSEIISCTLLVKSPSRKVYIFFTDALFIPKSHFQIKQTIKFDRASPALSNPIYH